MSRQLTSSSTLDGLKKEAKRWLKALRANDGDAHARLARSLPSPPADPTLRDVQHALAREYGLPGWATLKEQLDHGGMARHAWAELVTLFLENACPDHHIRGGPEHLAARHTALRLLQRHPDIAHDSFATEIVCGNLGEVDRALVERPALATEKSAHESAERSDAGRFGDRFRSLGPKGWEPLLYLCFTRLAIPEANDNAVPIARALLDHGADPNAYFMAGSSRYTPLVGAIGEGEEERPPHPQRDALVRLLLERGAEPYDIQVLYNIHFKGDAVWFLELIYEHSVRVGRRADWDDPSWAMLGMGGYGPGAFYLLNMAVRRNNLALAEWVLAHGGSPTAVTSTHPKFRPERTHVEEALRRGHTELADLLVRHGATPASRVPTPQEHFVAACLRLDRPAVETALSAQPALLHDTAALLEAARLDRADVVEMLLDLGASPNVADDTKQRPLHMAAYANGVHVARLLIDRGADVDPVESNWNNTPLGAAVYAQHRPMIELLGRVSRDVFNLTYTGSVARLRELLAEDPSPARLVVNNNTPLMWLPPDDEGRAIEIAEMLLAHGADLTIVSRRGLTAADYAGKLGMADLAALLRAAAARHSQRDG